MSIIYSLIIFSGSHCDIICNQIVVICAAMGFIAHHRADYRNFNPTYEASLSQSRIGESQRKLLVGAALFGKSPRINNIDKAHIQLLNPKYKSTFTISPHQPLYLASF